MKPFLILQLRPETKASNDEFEAILEKGGLDQSETNRIRLDRESIPDGLSLRDHSGVIVGGGPGCVSDAESEKTETEKRIEDAILTLMPAITDTDFPFLGCCYGIGILAHHLGAKVSKQRFGEEVGAVECQLTNDGKKDPLLKEFPDQFMAFVGHKEALQDLPAGCAHLLASSPCPYQMIRYKSNVYATQFHPEADSQVFEARINIYKNEGYFPPSSAEKLIEFCHQQDVRVPGQILRNFVQAYK
ncbi:MAG: glutamine amidotransferase [Hyphomicrobiales bacterium]|nr:glutamine amidotransferase [Hyphomicrobiales bacterium]